MADIDISHYSTGTATVAANGTAVTGQGTAWLAAVRPGDMFGTHKGVGIRIASVNSNTSLTLAYQWTGGAQTAAAYEIQRTPYDLGYQKAVEDLLGALQEGNVPLLSALTAAANKLPYFDSDSSMALADFPAWARALFAESGELPIGRIRNDLPPDKAFRRGNILGVVSQSGGVPTGAVIERGSNANGEYVRFADGTQICWGSTGTVTPAATNIPGLFTVTYNQDSRLFPASFIAIPVVFARIQSSDAGATPLYTTAAVEGGSNSTTTSNTGRIRGASNATILTAFYMWSAIGRWF